GAPARHAPPPPPGAAVPPAAGKALPPGGPRGLPVSGSVADRAGRPAAGLSVRAGPADLFAALDSLEAARDRERVPETRTDEDGRFALSGLPAGRVKVHLMVGWGCPYRAVGSDHLEVEAGATSADFLVEERPCLRMRVVDAAKLQPIPHATARRVECGRDADFLLVFGDSGARDVEILAEDFQPRTVGVILPDAGMRDHPERVVLQPAATAPFSGRVTDSAGQPLTDPRPMIFVASEATNPLAIRCVAADASGEFRFPVLAAGRHRILVFAHGLATARETLVVSEQPIRRDYALLPGDMGGTPPEPAYRWEERRDAKVTISCDDVPTLFFLRGLEEAAGIRIAREAREALEALEAADTGRMTLALEGVELKYAVQMSLMLQGLEFDEEAGVLRAAEPAPGRGR
ncbi:MAG: carboxypeptidase-like regulatory domain-containing protein, partial [Planctomycetales bacterium]|nr:carboxypeptidase-like regulatory domain-containing protein [Planctomycetales bacterium]